MCCVAATFLFLAAYGAWKSPILLAVAITLLRYTAVLVYWDADHQHKAGTSRIRKPRAFGADTPKARGIFIGSGISHVVIGDPSCSALALLPYFPLARLVQIGKVGIGRKAGWDFVI